MGLVYGLYGHYSRFAMVCVGMARAVLLQRLKD